MRPTLLGNVTNNMRVAQDEIFGPVVIIKFRTEEEVVGMANDSPYGLGAARSGHATSTGPCAISRAIETGRMGEYLQQHSGWRAFWRAQGVRHRA